MTTEALIAFNAALLVALIMPGPAMLLSIKASLSGGRRAGITAGLGLGTMAALWTLAAFLGLEVVFAVAPWSFAVMKTGGALYLIYIACKTWRGAARPVGDAVAPVGAAFLQGFLVNLGNPKSFLFAAAVIVVIFPAGLAAHEIAFVTVNHLVLEWLTYGTFALVMGSPAPRQAYFRAKAAIDRVAAGVIGALGLRLLLDRSGPA